MQSNRIRRTALPIGLAGVMAIAIVAGMGFSPDAVVAAPAPDKVAAEVRKALTGGQVEKAIAKAEELVAANPREASYRALLGQAYLRAGRFESAAQSLDDAMKLGDNSTRTALSLALAWSGTGRGNDAVAVLSDWRDAIPAADLGLAYALAGESSRGVAILAGALRGGESTPKLRQNLAYALALDGRWREARLMAAQDVPADKLDARISAWAVNARSEDARLRIAGLIGAPVRVDGGMPTRLALEASPGQQQLAAEASAAQHAPMVAAAGELPPADGNQAELAEYNPAVASAAAPVAVQAPAPAIRFVQQAVVQPIPASLPGWKPVQRVKIARLAPIREQAPAPRPRRAEALVTAKGSTHAIQLGAFSSEQGARRAWGHYAGRNPELRGFRMAVTPVKVKGKTFWRLAASGLDGSGAGGLCSKVKSRGGACFAYATTARPGGTPALAATARPRVPVMASARRR